VEGFVAASVPQQQPEKIVGTPTCCYFK